MENQRDSKKKGLSCLSWLQDAGMESRDQKGPPADSRKEMGLKPHKHRERGSSNHVEEFGSTFPLSLMRETSWPMP